MTDILSEICAAKADEVKAHKAARSLAALEAAAANVPPRGFLAALKAAHAEGTLAVIAETKQQSPSAGAFFPEDRYNPADVAEGYRANGAHCLSVLTDTPYFGGHLTDLIAVRATCPLPMLRKDFMIDPYQVAEAAAYGADAILIIMAAVSDALASELMAAATAYGLDTLVEVHDAAEMERALKLNPPLLGINNRNLKTLKTDLDITAQLAALASATTFLLSESGLKTTSDLRRVQTMGAKGILIGESLLRRPDPGAALSELTAELIQLRHPD
jgi:indole-3-glycerol phosphate synthase